MPYLDFIIFFIDEVDHMGDNKIAVTKPPMEKVSDFNGIPTSLEKKGNFRYIEKIAFFAKLGEISKYIFQNSFGY